MYEETRYRKHFLKQVIVRVDFVVPVQGFGNVLPKKLISAITKDFPILEPTEMIAQELQISADSFAKKDTRIKHWVFWDKSRSNKVTITPSLFTIVYDKYICFEDLVDSFEKILGILEKEIEELSIGRLGLRYINHIDIPNMKPPFKWEKYINSILLSTEEFFSHPNLLRLMHVAELKMDEIRLKYQFGVPNPDFPAIMKRPLYIIDIDAYVDMAHDVADTRHYLEQAHGHIQKLFEESITDALRKKIK